MPRMKLLAAFAATALSAGCATGNSDPFCPALVPYPPAVQTAAAEEIASGAAPTLARFAEDYGALRAALKAACQ